MPSREPKRTVYLIGPIRRLKEKKVWGWRGDARRRLEAQGLECLDFATNPDREKWAPQEIRYVRDCDVVLANMRRVSIGTTLGIVRARQSGRPVVLLVSRSFRSPMLVALVGQNNVTHSVPEACGRVASLVSQLDRTMLVEAGPSASVGRRDLDRLARLVSAAALAGDERDFGLEAIVLDKLMALLAPSDPDKVEYRTWSHAEHALRGAVEELAQDKAFASDLRKRMLAVRDAMGPGNHHLQRTEKGRRAIGREPKQSSDYAADTAPELKSGAPVEPLRARARRLRAEHGPGAQIMQLLLPNLSFVRDSIETILEELPDPASVIEQLRGLSAEPQHSRGEHFMGTDWRELRASTGESSVGRIYYHGTRKKLVLVSLKRNQELDKKWLQKPSNWSRWVED